jgi:hypothetical protein
MREIATRKRALGRTRSFQGATTHEALGSLRGHAFQRAHEALDEVPRVLRRLGTFLLIGSITMVAFAVGMLVVLWHAVG